MQIVKIALVMMTGLGSTWVARTTTEALLPGAPAAPTLGLTQVAGPATAPPDAGGGSEPEKKPPTAPEPISREEMAAEIRRAQAEIAGKPAPSDMEEFKPSRPLSADIAIALPSDT